MQSHTQVKHSPHHLESGPRGYHHREISIGFYRTILRARPTNDLHLFHSHLIGHNPVTWAQSTCKGVWYMQRYVWWLPNTKSRRAHPSPRKLPSRRNKSLLPQYPKHYVCKSDSTQHLFFFWNIILTLLFIKVKTREKLNNFKSIDRVTLEWKTVVACPSTSRNFHSQLHPRLLIQ